MAQKTMGYFQEILNGYNQEPQAALFLPNLMAERDGNNAILKADVNMPLIASYMTVFMAQMMMELQNQGDDSIYEDYSMDEMDVEYEIEEVEITPDLEQETVDSH